MRLAVTAAGGIDADEARRQARDVLEQRRYRPERVPKPFEGVLDWLGDLLRPVGEFLDDLLGSVAGRIGLALGIVVLAATVAMLVARRRTRGSSVVRAERELGRVAKELDPRALDREAEAAERAGDLDRALRLRFRAGLLRLDDAGAIRLRSSVTSGQVARRLRRPAFDDLAATFDAVAYGNRAASPTDVQAARDGWRHVLAELR